VLIRGSCHCGNIAFALAWEPDPSEIPARACNCSFCIKHGGVWTSNPTASLQISVQEPALVSKYSFGTRTAEFHICGRCGIVPMVTSLIEDRLYAVVSVNAFNSVDPSLLRRAPASFEGEDVGPRLTRRTRNWIANVQYVENVPAYQLTIEEGLSYLHATVVGPRNPENALRFLQEAHDACVKGEHAAVLLEMNLLGPSLDPGSIFRVISQRSSDATRLKRIAYVDAAGNPERPKFAETVATNRGVNVRLFQDLDAAKAWLSNER